MAKGKYAAKAANRAALVSDERVANLEQRLADLGDELASVRSALEHERHNRNRIILCRSQESAAAILAEAEKRHALEMRELEARMERAASELCRQWMSDADEDDVLYLFAEVLMPLLVSDSERRSAMVNKCLDSFVDRSSESDNRATRRRGDKRLRRHNQRMQFRDSGDELLARHGHKDALDRLLVEAERKTSNG